VAAAGCRNLFLQSTLRIRIDSPPLGAGGCEGPVFRPILDRNSFHISTLELLNGFSARSLGNFSPQLLFPQPLTHITPPVTTWGLSRFSRWGLSRFSRSENGTVPFTSPIPSPQPPIPSPYTPVQYTRSTGPISSPFSTVNAPRAARGRKGERLLCLVLSSPAW